MGRGYVIEHCISALKHNKREEVFREYIADLAVEIFRALGGEVSNSYGNIRDGLFKEPKPDREPEEVINSISEKLRKAGGGNNGE